MFWRKSKERIENSDDDCAPDFSSPWLHSRAINLLRNLLTAHDFDQRLTVNDEKYNRTRLARLYLPLLEIISTHLTQLFDPGNASFGQLNRPLLATPTDDQLTNHTDELTNTDHDGTLVNLCFSRSFEEQECSLICFRNVFPR